VTAAKIIDEIKLLPNEERAAVIDFVRQLDGQRQLTGKELAELAQRMVDSTDQATVQKLKREITRGFYGGKPNA
jgi:hypothetical protein